MAKIVPSVKNQDKRTQVELMELLMNKTKKSIVFIFSKWRNRAGEEKKTEVARFLNF